MNIVGLPDGILAWDIIEDLVTIGMCVVPLLLPFLAWGLYKRIMRNVG